MYSENITADTANFAQYDNLCIECYYDGLIAFTTKDKITIGTSSNSKEIANTNKQIHTFNLAEATIDDKITLSYVWLLVILFILNSPFLKFIIM